MLVPMVQGAGSEDRVWVQPLRPVPAPPSKVAVDPVQGAITPPSQALEPFTAEPAPPARQPAVPIPEFNPATLMGGGWAVTFPASDGATTTAQASFEFETQLVAAVASAAAMASSADLSHRTSEGDAALAAYHQTTPARKSLLEGVDPQLPPGAGKLDLLD